VRFAAVALAVMAVLSPLHAAAAAQQFGPADLLGSFANYDAMKDPTGLPGSDGYIATDLANRIYASLQKVLGGERPTIRFVQSIPPQNGLDEIHLEAYPDDNTITLDPYAMHALAYAAANTHSGAVNQIPHELMHLRQTKQVLASIPDREGGAQAFADQVAPEVAALVHTPYNAGLNFDGAYADYVKAAQARGRDWLFGGQMGKPPVAWP